MTDRIRITVSIEQIKKQVRLQVLHNTTIAELIDALSGKYQIKGDVELCLDNSGEPQPLSKEKTLGQHGVMADSTLVLKRRTERISPTQSAIDAGVRHMFGEDSQIFFEVESTGHRIRVAWQPGVIGRRNQKDPSKNHVLAVDLSDEPNGNYVSRHHACLTRQNGQYYIEHISANNSTYLNNQRLKRYDRRPIHAGDRVTLQKVTLIFKLIEN